MGMLRIVERFVSMRSFPLSLDTLKPELIQNREYVFHQESTPVSMTELIEFLVESLEDADKAAACKAENLLVRIGRPATPSLIQGLKSSHNTVRSACAMALIRIGEPVVDDLKTFFVRNAGRPRVRWVVEFILEELGAQVPAQVLAIDAREMNAAPETLSPKVRPLIKAAEPSREAEKAVRA